MKSRGKRLLLVVGALIVLPVILIALLPTLVNLGVGRGFITDAIEAQVNGTAKLDDVHLGWFGSQSASGLTIKDETGRQAANVDVTIGAGLLALALGAVDDLQVDVQGAIRGEMREDGSTSFADLFAAKDGDGARKKKQPKDGKPFSLAGVPQTKISLNDVSFTLDLRQETGVETLSIPKLVGTLVYLPGGESNLTLSGATEAGKRKGSIDVTARAVDLFDAKGRLTPKGALMDASVKAAGIPVPFDERVEAIDQFELTAKTADLAERLDVGLVLDTSLAGGDASRLTGTLAVLQLFAPDGTTSFALDRIEGEVAGSRVPTAILQPFLANERILLARDVGPSVDIAATFGAGTTRDVSIDLRGEYARVEIEAAVAPDRAIVGKRLRASAQIAPDLFDGLIAARVTVEATADSFRLPPPDAEGDVPLGAIALVAVITMQDAAQLQVTAGEDDGSDVAPKRVAALPLGALRLEVTSAALADGLRLNGAADFAGGRLEIDKTLADLFDEAGELSLTNATSIGSLTLTGVKLASLGALAEDPLLSDIASALLADALSATVRTSAVPNGLKADLEVRGAGLEVDVAAVRRADALELVSASAKVPVTPALVSALQGESETPVALAESTTLTVQIDPLDLPESATGGYAVPTKPVGGTIALARTRLAHPSLGETLVLGAMTAALTATLGDEPVYTVRGETKLRRDEKGRPLGTLACDLSASKEGDAIVPRGTLTISALALDQVERVLGLDPEAISGWLGATGSIGLEMTGEASEQRVTLRSDFPNVSGTLLAALDEEALTLESEGLKVTLTKGVLERLLSPTDEDADADAPAAAPESPAVALVAADMPLIVDLPRLKLPRTMLTGEPFDPKAVEFDARVTGGPLALADAKGVFSTIDALTGSIDCKDLSKGIHVALTGRATARDAAEPGKISIDGRIVNLTPDATAVDFSAARLHMEATAERVPTAVADGLLGLQGLLVAAAGNEMNATFTSRGFSRRSGYVDARIETSNGFVEGQIRGRAAGLRTTTDAPLHGELEILKPLRERLLAKIHPILADIRSTENPLSFAVTSNALIPLEGDMSAMRGDLEINVGKVEFDAGSTSLGFLRLFGSKTSGRTTFPGLIEPIVAKIRKGVVTYDRFAVQIDRYTLLYQGKIDLVNGRVDLRTEVPLAALALSVKELEGYADKIVVPIVTRGSFGKIETKVDPSFDLAGAAVQAGFQGALNEALDGKGLQLGNVLDEIFKKKDGPGG